MLYITSQSTECLHVSCITWFPWPPASQARRYQSDVTGEKSKAQSSWETARSLQQISRAGGLHSSLFILSPGPLSLTCSFQAEFGEGPRRSLGNYRETEADAGTQGSELTRRSYLCSVCWGPAQCQKPPHCSVLPCSR